MAKKDSLSATDWVLAGLAALAEGGIDAVRVERLARTLGTTKGSFYWHFADRRALLGAMIDFWQQEGTLDVIARLANLTDPADRLRRVARESLTASVHGIDTAHAEAALRAWAAQDESVALRLQTVEAVRAEFLATEFRRLGYANRTARELGRAIYLTLLGLYNARRYDPALASDRALLILLDTVIAAAPRA